MSKFKIGDLVKGARHTHRMCIHYIARMSEMDDKSTMYITSYFIGEKLHREVYDPDELELEAA